MDDGIDQRVFEPLERQLNLTPVNLKEAALDSPTFRAVALHFADQIELVERWLEGYVRSASKLSAEVLALESVINSFYSHSAPPTNLSEAVLDHDYTLLAAKRFAEGGRDFWHTALRCARRYDSIVIEPIKSFLNNDLRTFRDARRNLEHAQKTFDHDISRHAAKSTKDPSSLREDAFQLYETRKAYLKSCMDFCVVAPQVRSSLDKLLVKVFTDHWREMRSSRDASATLYGKWNIEIARIRGWSKEMEESEAAFKRELLAARRQIEESADQKIMPSRELEYYSISTGPYQSSGPLRSAPLTKTGQEKFEKQGWLFLRTVTGKPSRTVWSRRWVFVQNGIFGWLIQGARSGGVEESEKTGVLLCNIRPTSQEDRPFCFEVKTNYTKIVLQAETQQELTDWIGTFETAKRKALEDPTGSDSSTPASGHDLAFAISPPISSEFAARVGDGSALQGNEDGPAGSSALERESLGHGDFDFNIGRRVTSIDNEGRHVQRVDQHKRVPPSPQMSLTPSSNSGGIASLIAASHTILPVASVPLPMPSTTEHVKRTFSIPVSSLTPSTLVNPPAATNLSYTAVVVGGEKGVGLARPDAPAIPSVLLANLWGSSGWSNVNHLGPISQARPVIAPPAGPEPAVLPSSQDDSIVMDGMKENSKVFGSSLSVGESSPGHRKTISVGAQPLPPGGKVGVEKRVDDYPSFYPPSLKAQNAQFRMLFPSAANTEMVVMIFLATWNPDEHQEFPGRIYVTEREMYFFSNHLGLVLITEVSLSSISEITAATGRDCDFLYLHFKEQNRNDTARRITIKIFLEPLKLLQTRLNYLVFNASSEQPAKLREIIQRLMDIESENADRRSSGDSWDEIAYEEVFGRDQNATNARRERNVKASLRIDGTLYGDAVKAEKAAQKFKLPAQAIDYAPQGMQASIAREFSVSAKALFHVMFGDKSVVFHLLHCNRRADKIVQTPWTKNSDGHWARDFSSETPLAVQQVIEIFNDHLCYVVTEYKQPWRLPYSDRFSMTTKFVITHTAKSRCKLAIFQQMVWRKTPLFPYFRILVEKQALNALEADALDLTTVAMDQAKKLTGHSKTNRATQVFGNVGQYPFGAEIDTSQVTNLGGSLQARSEKASRSVSLLTLVSNDVLARLLRMLSLVLDFVLAAGKSTLSIFSAHTILIGLLVVSAVFNGWNGYRDGVGWYREWTTTRFMARMGVSPHHEMSKALYISEIDALVAPTIEPGAWTGSDSTAATKDCRVKFSELVIHPSSAMEIRSGGEGIRLRRSRAALARRRHDLVVALRVVNRVERDVVLAEWEEWVRFEETKCTATEHMLRQQRRDGSRDPGKPSVNATDSVVGEDLQRYCDSCRWELAALANGTALM